MYVKDYVFNGDYDAPVYRIRKARAIDRSEIQEIKNKLHEICETEASKLYRLAREMELRGCKPENVQKCRDEANQLHMCGYPERILDSFVGWEYAFQF